MLKTLRRVDWLLIGSSIILLGIGLLVLQSINYKDASLAQDFNPAKQIIFAVFGLGMMVLFAKTDYRLWFRLGNIWYAIGLFLLFLVLFFGTNAQGATRWINIGPLQFQPTEFIKLGLIMVLARFFTKHNEEMRLARYFLLSLVIVLVPAILVMIQPDLGSALVIGFIWFVMVIVSNANKWHLVALILAGLAFMPIAYTQLHPYQIKRIETFANPASDPRGSGYNVVQSTIAVGSGGLMGKGLSSGSQSQLNFLPSQQTDFIFAVLSEKLGFLGAGLVLALFVTLLARISIIAWRASDRFGLLMATGILAYFSFHIIINIGMNLGIMPVTGLPLPFISYGGTNLIISLMAIGILQSIALNREGLEFKS